MAELRWTRRDVLALGAACLGAAAAKGVRAQEPASLASDAMVVRNPRPLCVESPLAALRTVETPSAQFFVRSHLPFPPEGSFAPRLTIDGDVARPMTFTLDEIRRMPAVHRLVTLECAGNGRGRFALPSTSGLQWDLGAVGTARFTAVPLAALLERAGARASALHFWMEAADMAPFPAAPKFLRSLPREVALGDALVAYEMNGEPIAHRHGGPLRLVVPSWYGMASTKWLTHVHARATESDNFFQARGYRYADGTGVERVLVKSIVTSPLAEQRVPIGSLVVTGAAWTGSGSVRAVELSIDGGRTWAPSRFTTPEVPGAWRLFEASVTIAEPGEHTVRARATDTRGHVQPDHATPNPGGYGNNSIHEVRFHAVRS